MKLSIIVAVAEYGIIGRDNDLPWYLPADLKRFKQLTMGHHLLMGRKTFEAIGRALPGRTTVVITRGEPTLPEGVERAGAREEALALGTAAGDDEAFVAGGAEIYRQDRTRIRPARAEVHVRHQAHVPRPGRSGRGLRELHGRQLLADRFGTELLLGC